MLKKRQNEDSKNKSAAFGSVLEILMLMLISSFELNKTTNVVKYVLQCSAELCPKSKSPKSYAQKWTCSMQMCEHWEVGTYVSKAVVFNLWHGCGMQQTEAATCTTVADSAGIKKQSIILSRKHKAGNRKPSSRSGKGIAHVGGGVICVMPIKMVGPHILNVSLFGIRQSYAETLCTSAAQKQALHAWQKTTWPLEYTATQEMRDECTVLF